MGKKVILSDRYKGQAGMHDWYWVLSYTPIFYKSNHTYFSHIGLIQLIVCETAGPGPVGPHAEASFLFQGEVINARCQWSSQWSDLKEL